MNNTEQDKQADTVSGVGQQRVVMKRYLLFVWEEHNHIGGWSDFWGSFDTTDAAIDAAGKMGEFMCGDIVDTKTMGVALTYGDETPGNYRWFNDS